MAEDLTSDELIYAMYDPLVTYQGASNKIIGDMATHWTISPDGKTYTFTLRQGVTFWNGDPVTAQSYIAEFDRILTSRLGSPVAALLYPIIQGSTAYYHGKAKTVSGLSAPNAHTLVIHLAKPEPFFLEVLTGHSFVAVDPKWIQKVGEARFASNEPMGTGAFKMQSNNNTTQVLVRNPHYFMKDAYGNQLPYLNSITFNYNNNSEVDALNFEAGNSPFLAFNTGGIPSSAYNTFMHTPKLKQDIVTATAGDMWYVGLNVQEAPFTNLKVRQAVEYAINKSFIVKLLNNQYTVANQPVPPNVFGHVASLPASVDYKFNPTKAKQILSQSGLKLPIQANFYCSNDPTTLKIVQELQNELKAVGIQLNVHPLSWSAFLNGNGKGTQASFLIDWNQEYPDASDFLNTLLNTSEEPFGDSTMYSNPKVDAWLNQAQTDTNPQQRLALYKKVTVQALSDATLVPIYYAKHTFAIQPWVHGYYINQNLETDPLSHIWVDAGH